MKPFFIIVGSQDPRGATLSVAPDAYNVEIEHINQLDSYEDLRHTHINGSLLKIRAEARTKHFYHVEAGSYPEAWQRLFDLWVPPEFTEQTSAQILTHFTLNPA